MTRFLTLVLAICASAPALADIVVSTRTIRPASIITAADIKVLQADHADAYDRATDVIGQEARVALYPGRPIRFNDIGPPALVDRNQIVLLRFTGASLVIATEGRALERGGVGDRVRIMNLSSRATLFGFVQADGSVKVTN